MTPPQPPPLPLPPQQVWSPKMGLEFDFSESTIFIISDLGLTPVAAAAASLRKFTCSLTEDQRACWHSRCLVSQSR